MLNQVMQQENPVPDNAIDIADKPEKVLFLMHPDADGAVIAVFPHSLGTNDPKTMMSYEHVGQHGAVHTDYVNECRTATEEEASSLRVELNRIGYVLAEDTKTDIEDFNIRVEELRRIG